MIGEESVAVVVPLYNAEAVIEETLNSVRAQTHRALEIVVVDDGSTDNGPAIVKRHAEADSRIRLIVQPNGGVAAARNRGIQETTSRFVAPIDADDLWRADKIEKQLAAMHAGGDRVGLVYCWFSLINADSRVVYEDYRSEAEGDVIAVMLLRNIVGNGSSALMRREAIEACGGYDPSLRARQAQGCEDYKLYFAIAERWHYALVREMLVGYRETTANMSGDFKQMLRSRDICGDEIAVRHPQAGAVLKRARARLVRFMLSRALRTRQFDQACALLPELFRHDARAGLGELTDLGRAAIARQRRRSVEQRRFPAGAPAAGMMP